MRKQIAAERACFGEITRGTIVATPDEKGRPLQERNVSCAPGSFCPAGRSLSAGLPVAQAPARPWLIGILVNAASHRLQTERVAHPRFQRCPVARGKAAGFLLAADPHHGHERP